MLYVPVVHVFFAVPLYVLTYPPIYRCPSAYLGEFPVSRRWDLNLELSLQTLGSITTFPPQSNMQLSFLADPRAARKRQV